MVGKSHAAQVTDSGHFRVSQSGLWDDSILCSRCDNLLGKSENYAHKVFTSVREHGSDKVWQRKAVDGVNCDTLMRFFCGILYKFSITSCNNGQISLGPYQQVCRDIAFFNTTIPPDVDAFVFRPIRYVGDDQVFVYRTPLPDRYNGINHFRMMIGGMLIFVKLDKRPIVERIIAETLVRNAPTFIYLIAQAQDFEEFRIPERLIKSQQKLSDYLDNIGP